MIKICQGMCKRTVYKGSTQVSGLLFQCIGKHKNDIRIRDKMYGTILFGN